MKTLLKSLAFLAVATLAGTAFGYGIGDSFFYFNGTRYTGSNPYEESAGYAESVTATIDTSYVTEKFFKAAIGAPQTEDPWEEPGEEE